MTMNDESNTEIQPQPNDRVRPLMSFVGIACQTSCRKVMFSVVSVHQSVILSIGRRVPLYRSRSHFPSRNASNLVIMKHVRSASGRLASYMALGWYDWLELNLIWTSIVNIGVWQNKFADELVDTEVIDEIVMGANEEKPVSLLV